MNRLDGIYKDQQDQQRKRVTIKMAVAATAIGVSLYVAHNLMDMSFLLPSISFRLPEVAVIEQARPVAQAAWNIFSRLTDHPFVTVPLIFASALWLGF